MQDRRRKGQKIIHGMWQNWTIETDMTPTNDELINRLLIMEDEEFDAYVRGEDYVFRQEMHEEADRQQKLILDKKSKK